MTRASDFKRLIRARMRATGERFTAARSSLLREREVGMIPVGVTVRIRVDRETRGFLSYLRSPDPSEPSKDLGDSLDDASTEVHFFGAGGSVATASVPRGEADKALLILRESEGQRVLPIYCGQSEALSIAIALQGIQTQRPLTHDLLQDALASTGSVQAVRVTELQDTTYLAELEVLRSTGETSSISCRPSDGIAVAVRVGASILVSEDLLMEPRERVNG